MPRTPYFAKRKSSMAAWKKWVSGLFLLVAILVLGAALYILHLGGVRQILEDQLTQLSDGITVDVGAAHIDFAMGPTPFAIVASDIAVQLETEEVMVPHVRVGFGLASLRHGQPSDLELDGLTVDLVRTGDGWQGSSTFALVQAITQAGSRSSAMTGDDGGAKTGQVAASPLGGLETITIHADRLSIRDESTAAPTNLTFAEVDLRVLAAALDTGSSSSDPGLDVAAVGVRLNATRIIGDAAAGQVSLWLSGWIDQPTMSADVRFDALVLDGLSDFIPGFPAALADLGAVTGGGRGRWESQILTQLDLDVLAVGGRIAMPGSGKRASFSRANATIAYDRAEDFLNLNTIGVELADERRLELRGAIADFHSERPLFKGNLQANRLSVQSLYEDWPTGLAQPLKSQLEAHFSGGAFTDATLDFAGGIDRRTMQLQLAKLTVGTAFSGIRMNASAGQLQRLVGTIDGDLDLRIDVGGQVRGLDFTFGLNQGSMQLVDTDQAIPITTLALAGALKGRELTVSELDLQLANGGTVSVGGTARLAPDWRLTGLDLDLSTSNLDIDLFHAIWPEWAVKNTRAWVRDKFPSGKVEQSRLRLGSRMTPNGLALDNLSASLALADARLVLGGNIPVFDALSAEVVLDETTAEVVLKSAQVGDLAVQRGRVEISPILNAETAEATATLAVKGGFDTALQIASGFGVGEVGAFDIGALTVAGEVEAAIAATFPVTGDIVADDVDVRVEATLSGGSLRGLPLNATVDAAEIVANFEADVIEVTGSAEIVGVPGNFSFVSDQRNQQVEFLGKALPSSEMASYLASFTGMNIEGKTGGTVAISSDTGFAKMRVGLALDMRQTGLDVPLIGWTKLPAEPGTARLTFLHQNGRISSLDDIDIQLGSLAAQGQIALARDGGVQAALFDRVSWPGNDIRNMSIERGGSGYWQVDATARTIDLTPLRENQGVGEGEPVIFDVIADQINVGQDIALNGHLTGEKNADGGGKATFNGNLQYEGRPLITEASVDLRYGVGGDFVNGTGLVGGAESTIAYSALEDGPAKLVLTSENGGRMLAGLGVTDTISSGKIVLTNGYVEGDLGDFNTVIHITDFNVLEAPSAIKAFSVLGPMGLYNLVEGEGTRFAWGEAEFEKRGSLVRLQTVRAGGDAVALSLVGTYDTATRKVDVGGNLVPASFLSNVFSVIPVLGELLTGVDKSGIFVTQFRMEGDIDDPQTTVSPASIVPGLLRDFVSPNWLKREADRLFGDDNSTPEAAAETETMSKPQTDNATAGDTPSATGPKS